MIVWNNENIGIFYYPIQNFLKNIWKCKWLTEAEAPIELKPIIKSLKRESNLITKGKL